MEYRENWCSDMSSGGSLNPGSILPWKSFERLSWKQGRNQKQRLIPSTHRSQCSSPTPVYARLVTRHSSSLGRLCVWRDAEPLFLTCVFPFTRHCKTLVVRVCMKWTDKPKLVVKLKCVSVVLFFCSLLIDPLIPPAEQQRCCCSCQMLTAAN